MTHKKLQKLLDLLAEYQTEYYSYDIPHELAVTTELIFDELEATKNKKTKQPKTKAKPDSGTTASTFEIMFNDLNPKARQQLLDFYNIKNPEEANLGIVPLAILDQPINTDE